MSVVIWRDPLTGVYAEWNKDGSWSVFVPRFERDQIAHGDRTFHVSREAAIRSAKRKSAALLRQNPWTKVFG